VTRTAYTIRRNKEKKERKHQKRAPSGAGETRTRRPTARYTKEKSTPSMKKCQRLGGRGEPMLAICTGARGRETGANRGKTKHKQKNRGDGSKKKKRKKSSACNTQGFFGTSKGLKEPPWQKNNRFRLGSERGEKYV